MISTGPTEQDPREDPNLQIEAGPDPSVELTALKDALSHVPTPVTVISLEDLDGAHGSTVGSFAALSIEPPLVMAGLDRTSNLLRRMRIGRRIGVNVLAMGQEDVARRCASKGSDKLGVVPTTHVDGALRIEGVASWFLCEVQDLLPGGDHEILVAKVLTCERWVDRTPLVYHLRAFGTPRELAA